MKVIPDSAKNAVTHFIRFLTRTQLGFLGYRAANLTELKKLQSIYTEFLDKPKNEIVKDSGAKSITDKALINMLEIDWSKKKPQAIEQQIADCFVFKKPSERGDLTADCESIFNIVKDSIEQRLAAGGGTYEQTNSAIVLFSAEFSTWLIQLAARPCEESTYKDVWQRIQYLEAIIERTVFPDETKNDFSIHKIIYNVVKLLEKNILPRILWKIDEASAREHFDRIIKHAEAAIREAINGLFLLYSDSENAKAFDFATYRDIKNTALQSMLDTRLGDTLQYLSNLHIALQPGIQDTNTESLYLTNNSFLERGRTPNAYLLKTLDTGSKQSRPLGIHSVMQQKDLISAFVLQLGYLNDFGVLLLGFRKAYRLCGQGGNYLMYVELCQETYSLLATYAHLIQQSQQGFMTIQNACLQLFDKHIEEYTESTWRKHFLGFKAKMRNMGEELKNCKYSLIKLLQGMEAASQIDYKKELLKEIKEFRNLINAVEERLGGQSQSIDNNTTLAISTAPLNTSLPSSPLNTSLPLSPLTSHKQLEDTITDATMDALLKRAKKTVAKANLIEESKENKKEFPYP